MYEINVVGAERMRRSEASIRIITDPIAIRLRTLQVSPSLD